MDETQRELEERVLADARDRRDLADIAEIMGTAGGRRFMHTLLHELCGVEQLGWTADVERRAFVDFNAGARNVGLQVLHRLRRACPKMIVAMDEEAERPSRTTA